MSGSGDIKLTKDGNVLLHEMVCQFLCCIYLILNCLFIWNLGAHLLLEVVEAFIFVSVRNPFPE